MLCQSSDGRREELFLTKGALPASAVVWTVDQSVSQEKGETSQLRIGTNIVSYGGQV